MDTRPRGDIRVSDVERDQAVTDLGEAFASGRLTQEEFDERSTRAWSARTGNDLSALFTDLPRAPLPQAPVSPAPVLDDYRPLPRYHLPVIRVVIALVAVSAVLGTVFGHHHSGVNFGWLVPVVLLGVIVTRMCRR